MGMGGIRLPRSGSVQVKELVFINESNIPDVVVVINSKKPVIRSNPGEYGDL
jgi:hypothetical protein